MKGYCYTSWPVTFQECIFTARCTPPPPWHSLSFLHCNSNSKLTHCISTHSIPCSGAVTPESSPVCSTGLHWNVRNSRHSHSHLSNSIPIEDCETSPFGGHAHVPSSSCSRVDARSSIGMRWSPWEAQNALIWNVVKQNRDYLVS